MPVNPTGQATTEDAVVDLQRRVRALETANPLENASIGSGGVTIKDGGSVTVLADDGTTICTIGRLPGLDRSGGLPQPGFALYREDGSIAAVLADANPTVPPFKQAWQVYDRAGSIVLADDTDGGYGLAVPNLASSTMVNGDYTQWPKTAASSFTTIAYCWYQVQNPTMQWCIDYTGDVGTAGQFRMMVSWPFNTLGYGRLQIGTTQSQDASGSFGEWFFYDALPYPSSLDLMGGDQYLYFELQARVTSGAGKMYGVCSQIGGGQS